MNELIELIMNDEELSIQEKTMLIEKVATSSHGIDKQVTPGFYLHTNIVDNAFVDVQLWYRNVDESGTVSHGPTNWNAAKIVQLMKEELIKHSKTK